MEAFAERMPGSLSGGERRRVALAQVLALEPSVLLLDEPTLNLDPPARAALLRDLKRVQRDMDLSVLHVTHDFEEAFAQADRVSVMRDGRLVQTGTADEVFRSPRDEDLARFVGVENILGGRVVEESGEAGAAGEMRFDTGHNRFVLSERGSGTRVILRAEDILLAREPPQTSARNVVRARVVSLEDRGATARVGLDANGDLLKAIVTRSALQELDLRLGDEAYAAFKASALRLL
jgi:molybdopterin-binding protein